MFVKTASLSAALVLALFAAGPTLAQDAMSTDAMAPMMSDDDLKTCLDQAMAITFPDVAMVAEEACHNLHNGQGAMGGDAMMAGDAMAPKQ